MQRNLELLSSIGNKFCLNPKKAMGTYQPLPGVPYEKPVMKVYEHCLIKVDNFTSLGSVASCCVIDDEDIL